MAPTVVIMSADPTLPMIPTLNIFPFAFPRLPPKSIPYFVLMSSLTFPSSIAIGLFTAATVWDRDSFFKDHVARLIQRVEKTDSWREGSVAVLNVFLIH